VGAAARATPSSTGSTPRTPEPVPERPPPATWAAKEPAPVAEGDADTALGGAADFCYLTTRGRKSGRPHTIEIWFAEDAGRLFMMAGGGERADWVRNLMAHPAVGLRVGSYDGPATAAVVADEVDEARARRLVAAKYQGWEPGSELSEWARTALPVVVVPQPGQAGGAASPANP
jgi:deazaflavin-dependent oxidoreductase (nitroreductase family)